LAATATILLVVPPTLAAAAGEVSSAPSLLADRGSIVL
jgi:hypothetical protein